MSHKSNLITLRKRSPILTVTNEHSKLVIHLISFINIFIKLLTSYGIWVLKTYLLTKNNLCQINLCIYISSRKLINYKHFILEDINTKSGNLGNSNNNFLNKIFQKFFKFYKKSVYLFNFNCINSNIDIKFVQLVYPLVQQQLKKLFVRRFNLLTDFLNITALFCQNFVGADKYLYLLSQIFKYLNKRQHSSFISFIQEVFKKICLNSSISGIKFIINGKLKGKTRASRVVVVQGGVSNQTISSDIDFAVSHTYTRLGAFGMRIWVQRD